MPGDKPPDERGVEVKPSAGTVRVVGGVVSVVSLNQEAQRDGLTVSEQIALRDATLREWLANRVVPAFVKTNVLTLVGLAALVALDESNLALHLITPADRVIGENVIIALLGATTVQLATIAALIAR